MTEARVLCAERCHLGEGSIGDPSGARVWWVDILERRLWEADLATGAAVAHALPFMASAVAWIDPDRQLLIAEDGLHVRERDGALSKLMTLEPDRPGNRSNDARVHPSGALWTSTMGRKAEPGAGAIYHVFRGQVSRLFAPVSIANAICFAPDGAMAYFVDSPVGILHRVPVDPADGRPTGPPVPLYDHRGGEGSLDGAVTDSEGLIWNAHWGAGCVAVYTPAGQVVRTVKIPATRPSCPAFVGPGLDQLVVSTAYENMTEAEKRADPEHGRTFIVPVAAIGLPAPWARVTV